MREVQFIRSLGQGNIYSTSRFGNVTLTATGNCGRVLAHVNSTTLLELLLSSIPLGSDIIAVDACQGEQYIIGVTFMQTTQLGIEEVRSPYLNFYAIWSPIILNQEESIPRSGSSKSLDSHSTSGFKSSRFRGLSKDDINLRWLETIGQKCVQFKLNFTPYHLSHTRVQNASTGLYETLFLLTGSDCRIHLYKPNTEIESFTQVPIQIYYPELYGVFPSIITRVHIVKLQNPHKRLTICGCEDGLLRSYIISKSETLRIRHQSPVLYYRKKITLDSDRLLAEDEEEKSSDEDKFKKRHSRSARTSLDTMSYLNEDIDLGAFVKRVTTTFDGMITAIDTYWNDSTLNVVVASAKSPVFLFKDVVNHEFQEGLCLKFSSKWDSVQALCVADIDDDGDLEIIVGTYGCTILVYKFLNDISQWVIVAHHKFPSAIFGFDFINTHLSVITASGLHVIEYSSDIST